MQTIIDRILALIPTNPQILEMDTPFELCNIPEFKISDLQPAYHHVATALKEAQAQWSMYKPILAKMNDSDF